MSNRSHNNAANKGGYALITALIFFLAASTAVIAGLSDSVIREVRTIRTESASRQSYLASESALEDALYRLKKGKQINSTESLSTASSTAAVTITTEADGTKTIRSSADWNTTQRNTQASLNPGVLAVFSYALQAGAGGIDLTSNVTGDSYTTGSIRGCGSCTISGTAIAAGKTFSSVEVDNSTPVPPTQTITFGNSSVTQDMAESFTISENLSITDLQIFVKKVGSPANATIKLVNDDDGKPGDTVISQSTLSSMFLGPSYSWQTVIFSSNPVLSAGSRYWVVIDADTNASAYYIIAANTGYAGGEAAVGNLDAHTWFETSPAGLDSYFKLSIGANHSGITGENQYNRLTVGTGYSYNMSYVQSTGALYCKVGTDNNKACDTSRADPPILPFPITNDMIDRWKTEASVAGTTSGDPHVGNEGMTLGPRKIEGNLSVSGGGTLTLTGTVWVTGSVSLTGGSTLTSADNSHSFVLIADGPITIGGGSEIADAVSNHIVLISTSSADPAITVTGGSTGGAMFAPNGGISIQGGATFKSVAANHVTVGGGALVIYDSDMAQINFSGSSTGGMGIKSWKEVE